MIRSIALAALAAVALSTGCKKDKPADKQPADVTTLVAKPAAVDASKLVAPALFAQIPADTPYLVGSFEAVPLDYWAKLKEAIGPALRDGYAKIRASADVSATAPASAGEDADATLTRLADAVLAELGGSVTAANLEKLGFTASARFAFYGLGLEPVVFRAEVGNDKTLLATIERVAKRAQVTLPTQETHQGRSYWRVREDEMSFVIALVDNQLVGAAGTNAGVDRSLGLILGTEKPQASMADGKTLASIATTHGFGPHMIGFLDTKRTMHAGMQYAGRQPSAACTAAIDAASATVPRIVMGYTPLTGTTWSGGMVVELSPAAVTALRPLKVEVPGLATAVTPTSLFAMGGGIDLERARQLAITTATSVRALAQACEVAEIAEATASTLDTLSNPVPQELAGILGGALAVEQLTFDPARPGLPKEIEGVAFVSARDAKAVFGSLAKMTPMIGQLGVKSDGKLHAIQGVPFPIPLHGGVGAQTIVVGAGNGAGKQLAERVMASTGTTKAPFMIMSYDYGRFLELQSQLQQLTGDGGDAADVQAQMNAGLAKLFGRVSGSLDVGDKGLVFWGSMEVK